MSDQAIKKELPPSIPAPKTVRWFQQPFDALLGVVSNLGEISILTWQSLLSILKGGFDTRDLITQMASVGADSIWIVLAITSATGAVFALYTTNLALQIGFTQFVGGTMSYGFLNELGPVLGGVAFAARSGAAIAAEIGSMTVTEQVDALKSMAVSPVRYLVAPRVLASIIMLPLLTVLADADLKKRALELGIDTKASAPAEIDARMKADIAKWSAVIEKAGIAKQ